ncbi:MAG: ChaN family lipoprotein, partial [Rubrivivax sp.]|nr:ChaN family lipoprotein [Rubrivivax sp.]
MSRRCRFAAFARIGWLARRGGAVAAAAVLGACALPPGVEADRVVDVATGQALTRAQVMQRVRAADVVLLGELHDNAHHHARRATLLGGLPGPAVVVAEHLVRGAAPALPRTASGETLRQALVAAGFDARGWRWPLH